MVTSIVASALIVAGVLGAGQSASAIDPSSDVGATESDASATTGLDLTPEIPEDRVIISYWDGNESDLTSEQKAELDAAGVDLDEDGAAPAEAVTDELLAEAGTCDIDLGEQIVDGLQACASDSTASRSTVSSSPQAAANASAAGENQRSAAVPQSTSLPAASPCLRLQWQVKYISRMEACIASSQIVYVVSRRTGQVVGNFLLEMVTHTVTQKSLIMEANNYTWLRTSFPTGYVVGREVTAVGQYRCSTAGCTHAPASFNEGINGQWKKAQGSSKLTFGPSADPKPLRESWTFTLAVSGASSSAKVQGLALKPRCDNNAINGLGQGCVFAQFVSTFKIPATGKTAAAGQHIAKAISSGLPSTLTRTSPAKAAANRSIACAFLVSMPREPDYECDEYPPASSQQGGSADRRILTGCRWAEKPGAGPVGVSVCLTPGRENNEGGKLLQKFYRDARIIEGDTYKVQVT